MSNVYDMSGHKKVLFDEEEKDCEEGICCTKCWTKAVKKLRGD
ncbi:MAG: hypothetical protein ACLVGD_04470 [Monoglobales bacterium]